MEIFICQCCGIILRGKNRFCTGCGAVVSKFSPTALPIITHALAPLAMTLEPDPLTLERALNRLKYSSGNGNDSSRDFALEHAGMPLPTAGGEETSDSTQHIPTQQDSRQPSSYLASVLSSAVSLPSHNTVSNTVSELISFVAEEKQPDQVELPEVGKSETAGAQVTTLNTSPELQVPVTASISPELVQSNEKTISTNVLLQANDFFACAPMPPLSNEDCRERQSFEQASQSVSLINATEITKQQARPQVPEPVAEDIPTGTISGAEQSKVAEEVREVAASEESLFPDESIKRGQGRSAEKSLDAKEADPEPTKVDDSTLSRDNKKEKGPEKQIHLFGFSISRKIAAIAAILLVFVGFPVFTLLGNLVQSIGSGISGLGSTLQTQQAPVLSGRWEFGFISNKGKVYNGVLNIIQKGKHIEGYGVDGLQYQIKGELNYPRLTFNKQYIENGALAGRPILHSGIIDWINPNHQPPYMHISGIWQLVKDNSMRFGGWQRQVVATKNKWEAKLVEQFDPNQLPNSSQGAYSPLLSGELGIQPLTGGNSLAPKPSDTQGMQSFFLKIAIVIVVLCVLLAVASLKMFGPSGLINIWEKRKYIPSQFKSEHYKIVKELGKPLQPGGIPLGQRLDWNIFQFHQPKQLALSPELREANPHMLVLGAGAKGKSRLVASLISHDIQANDRSVVVIDSDGGLVDLIKNWIGAHPQGRKFAERVIIVDPAYESEKLAYNPLEFPEDGDLQNAASAVVFGFKAIYTEPPGSQSQWNQQTANILRNAAVLLMANGKTLTDLPKLLSDNDFRDELLEKIEKMKQEKVEYTTLIEAWGQYKRLARTDQWINWVEPILNRVQPMLGDPRIRPMLTKAKGDLNLKGIISGKKILLVKIPQGQLDQNANLLGSLIVTGLKQATLSLSLRSNSRRHPCALYLDEFDNFIEKETFDAITSETKKFQIGFIGASKTLQTLPEDYRNQIIINTGTINMFALAKKDGDMLGPQMFRVDGRKMKHQTIQNIFNKVNTSPQFELISDEEKLNIDRVVGQEDRTYFCYRVGTVAGVFHMRSPDFKDVPEKDVNESLIDLMYANRQNKDSNTEPATKTAQA